MSARVWVLMAAALTVAGCAGEEHSDLKAFVKESDNLPRGRIPPLPEAKPYEPTNYNAYDLTDPFKPRKIEPPRNAAAGGLQPDFNRRKEPLEAYPLENLKMVGTLQQKADVFAIIRTPDNNLFRIKTGNYLGQNFGRVIGISEAGVKLKEIVQDSSGAWEEKEQVLQLQEQETRR